MYTVLYAVNTTEGRAGTTTQGEHNVHYNYGTLLYILNTVNASSIWVGPWEKVSENIDHPYCAIFVTNLS